MKAKLLLAPSIVLIAALMLAACEAPVASDQESIYRRDDAAARARERAVERQERRARRRDGSFDRGFSGL